MIKLIRADLARMFKTKSFWICGVISVVSAFGNFLMRYLNNKPMVNSLGNCVFADSSNVVLFAAIFAALFLGTDYSNGTIRNKMTVGHGRCSIYFSNFITSSIGGLLYSIAARLPVLIFGLSAGGKLGMSGGEFALKSVIAFLSMIAVCSLLTLTGMLISVKSSNVVVTLVGMFVLLMGMAMILQILEAPEYISGGYQITADGTVQPMEPELNPLYVRGAMRVFLQTVCDMVPTGQAMQLEWGQVHAPELMPVYSIGFTAAVSVIGVTVFRRKDLK